MSRSLALSIILLAGTSMSLALSVPRGTAREHRSSRDRRSSRKHGLCREHGLCRKHGELGPPGLSLAVVIALIYLNQLLFTVYVLRVHHGDPAFIARYLPAGWFTLARGGAITAFARWFPAPSALSFTVLRVQAFLELPFVTFGYLTVCRWFSADAYQRAQRLVWPLSLTWTATFCLIEWTLRNPYTIDDLAIRAVAAVAVPLWAGRLSRAGDDTDRVPGLPGLLVFTVSTVALSMAILTVYETALLYNLGGLGAKLPTAAAALVVLAAARFAARFVRARTPGAGVESVTRSFGMFLVVFAVPALPVRYGLLGSGTRFAALAAALAVIAFAAAVGVRETLARTAVNRARWLTQMGLTVTAGLIAGSVGYALTGGEGPQARLIWAAAVFLACGAGTCALLDRRLPAGARLPLPGRP